MFDTLLSADYMVVDADAIRHDSNRGTRTAHASHCEGMVWGWGVHLVEQDIDMVMAVCDQIVVLESGSVLTSGAPAEIAASKAVIEANVGGSADQDDVVSLVKSVAAPRDEVRLRRMARVTSDYLTTAAARIDSYLELRAPGHLLEERAAGSVADRNRP
jgi:hypothetical protein